MNLLSSHRVAVLRSQEMLAEVEANLAQLGWDDAARATARQRLGEVTTEGSPVGAGPWEVALAKGAGLDRVYAVGQRSGQVVDGVAFVPVRELLEILSAGD
jgi:hypothetical protein